MRLSIELGSILPSITLENLWKLMMRIYKLNTYQYSVFTKRKQPRDVTVKSYSKVDVCKVEPITFTDG